MRSCIRVSLRCEIGKCDFYCNILSDINLYDGDLENQIDFLVITKKMCFVIECKNWSKTTKVLADGRFERQIYGQGKGKLKQVPSPIEQNNEHTQLVKNIYMKNRKKFSKASKNESIGDRVIPVLVWVNNNAELDLQDATGHIKNEVEKQFVYAERLATHLNKIYKDSLLHEKSVEEVEELSRIFMEIHKKNEEEYIRKNRQRALSAVLETLEFVPQDFLKRELEAYRKLDWVNEIIKTKNKKYKEHLLDEEMIEKLTEKMPANREELIQIDWFKAFTYENFGEDILEILNRYREVK